jgi:hypothetical protein
LRRDLKGNNTAGAVLTTREDGNQYSRLVGTDARIYHGGKYFLEGQLVGSWSEAGSGAVSGSFSNLTWDRTGRRWGFNYSLNAISPDFEAAAGFVNRTDIVSGRAFNRLSFYGKEGALVETIGGFTGITRIWQYADTGRGPIEGSESVFPSATLRGGWRLSGSLNRNFFSYNPATYADYVVVASPDAAFADAFEVPEKETNQWSGSLGVTTPTFRLFTLSLSSTFGQTPIFVEASRGYGTSYSAVLDARPTSAVRVSFQMQHYTLNRRVDDSQFSREIIPRVKVEYQLTPDIFFRVIAQYASRERSALKDRNGRMIRVNGVLTEASQTNDLRMDWLFSYRPNPGTLLYLGYGATMEDAGQRRFENLQRLSDGFFLKLSYLFRV